MNAPLPLPAHVALLEHTRSVLRNLLTLNVVAIRGNQNQRVGQGTLAHSKQVRGCRFVEDRRHELGAVPFIILHGMDLRRVMATEVPVRDQITLIIIVISLLILVVGHLDDLHSKMTIFRYL